MFSAVCDSTAEILRVCDHTSILCTAQPWRTEMTLAHSCRMCVCVCVCMCTDPRLVTMEIGQAAGTRGGKPNHVRNTLLHTLLHSSKHTHTLFLSLCWPWVGWLLMLMCIDGLEFLEATVSQDAIQSNTDRAPMWRERLGELSCMSAANKPASQSTSQSVSQQPTSQSVNQPASQSVSQSVNQSVSLPAC